jgi:hypothetical protein
MMVYDRPARAGAAQPMTLGRRWLAVLAATILTLTACVLDRPPAPATPPSGQQVPAPAPAIPRSLAALGDSITRAAAACEAFDCPAASWSTGTHPGLASHAQRIRAVSGAQPQTYNLAVSGARVADLHRQAQQAVDTRAGYVTVLIGANDACALSETTMTPVAAFDSAFARALDTLVQGLPEARILVLSIPDLGRLWQVGKDLADVRETWRRLRICQSMLADPTSTTVGDQARRTRVRDRVIAYNTAMARVCGRHPTCRWDGDAVFRYRFPLTMVSSHDYFHPSLEGQRTLAETSWRAGYWP